MKKLLLAIAILATSLSYGQTFNDVYIGGSLEKVVSNFRSKGYLVSKYLDVGVLMKGKLGYEDVELYILVTPKSKQVFKAVAYLTKKDSWTSLKSQYNRYKEALTNKYGEPDSNLESFDSPYYEGDGYEIVAFANDKASYNSIWLNKGNANIAVQISEDGQVKLIYENNTNMELKRKEVSEIEMKNL